MYQRRRNSQELWFELPPDPGYQPVSMGAVMGLVGAWASERAFVGACPC